MMQINLAYKGTKKIWFMEFINDLDFDPLEWTWDGSDTIAEKAFFNYSA
jgi:hypothetical protein